jgi:hypothetical protein
MIDGMQIVADKIELLEVVQRYCRAIDRRDYDLLRSVYHPGAIDLHGSNFQGPVEGFIEVVPRDLEPYSITSHMITNALFVVDGDTAEGESCVLANHVTKDNPPRHLVAAARYLDRFERRDGVWRIAHRTCVLDWSNVEGGMDPGAIAGRVDKGDESYTALPMLCHALAAG